MQSHRREKDGLFTNNAVFACYQNGMKWNYFPSTKDCELFDPNRVACPVLLVEGAAGDDGCKPERNAVLLILLPVE